MRHFTLRNDSLLFILVVALFAFGMPGHRVSAAVLQVDESCSLRDAIIAANTDSPSGGCPTGAGADTIHLTSDVTLTEELPVIESVISIEGDGFTISGRKRFRIFDVQYGRLGINDVTLSDGHLDERRDARGSAIRLRDGAQVTVENSTFSSNTAGAGGAIYTAAWNVVLDINRSTFRKNESEFGGGAIQVDGGTVNISNSSFSKNSSSGVGGAIEALRGRLRVWNSTFSQNRAYRAGAIDVDGAEATLTHLTLAENRSSFGGDSLVKHAGLLRLRNSVVSGDSSEDDCLGRLDQNTGNLIADWSCRAPLGGNPLLGNYEGAPGYRLLGDGSPALDAADPEFCLDTDQIGTPRAQGGSCDIGAIESTSAALSPIPIKSICNLSFQITAANQDRWIGACPPGDGADTIELTEDITLTAPLPRITSDITINGNGHTIDGDNRFRIFDVERGNFAIQDLTLTNGNALGESGGAISLGHWAVFSATHVTFINNVAAAGGAITMWFDAQMRIRQSSFRDNVAGYRGGAIDIQAAGAEISNTVFSGNRAGSYGGAIHSSGTVFLNNTTLEQNSARLGGGIYFDSNEITLTHVSLIDNHSRNGGDAIFRREGDWGKINLRNSVIAGGSERADCVGHLEQNSGNLIEDGTCFPSLKGDPLLESLTDSTGLFAPQDASPLINSADPKHCLDTDQIGTPRPVGAGCDIGAIEAMSDFAATALPAPPVCTLYDHILAANSNSAVGHCPAGSNHDIITISEDIILRERLPAITGTITIEGGGHTMSGNNLYRLFEVDGGNLTINNLTLTEGYSHRDGGALYAHSGGRVAINDSTFSDNIGTWGGAISSSQGATALKVNRSLFVANQASWSSGAIQISSGDLQITNSSFMDNSGRYGAAALSIGADVEGHIMNSTFVGIYSGNGGAITARRAKVTLSHVTILDKSAAEDGEGFAIYTDEDNSRLRLFNSIIAGRSGPGEMCQGQLLESSGNLIEDGSCAPAVRGNPLLGDLTGSLPYLSVLKASPAIDSADPVHCPPTDQIGNPRPHGAGCDIGAVEYMEE